MEVINSLLQEKEHRLSSKKYRMNDYKPSKRTPGQAGSRLADPHACDYQGNYVYPDDATDIKAHRFFRRISWERLHLTRPPFVPDISGGDDTKYFDEEEPISDVDDTTSRSGSPEATDDDLTGVAPGVARIVPLNGFQDPDGTFVKSTAGSHAITKDVGRPAKKPRLREKKRPRDRVLRDRDVGKEVLELRKKGAFLGYNYRRPRLHTLEEERGRQRLAKRSQILLDSVSPTPFPLHT